MTKNDYLITEQSIVTYLNNNKISIIDSHVHFWDPDKLDYPWLKDHIFLNKRFLPVQFENEFADHKIRSVIAIQADVRAGLEIKEADFINGLAQKSAIIGASVTWAPIELGEQSYSYIDKVAELLIVRGIRRNLQFDPDPNLCLRPSFHDGVRYLSHHGLSFDICVDQSRLKNILILASHCPETPLILNHLGKPEPTKKGFAEWCSLITELAKFPNVSCKLSGLLAQIYNGEPAYTRPEPYLMKAYEEFGTRRIMFGSDWPVSSRMHSYNHWLNQLLTTFKFLCESDLHLIFHENAKNFYKIGNEINERAN